LSNQNNNSIQLYRILAELITNLYAQFDESDRQYRNFIKFILFSFAIKFFEIFNKYITRFTSTAADIRLFENQKIYWFDLELNDKLYNRFVNIIDVININNLISRLRDINFKIKQIDNYQQLQTSTRNRFVTIQINKNRNITRKFTSRSEIYNNKSIIRVNKQKSSFETELVFWSQTFKNKFKKKNLCRKCLQSEYRFYYSNALCKNESAKIKKKLL